MATLSDLRTRVRAVIRDDAGVFVTNANILAWLNEAQNDLANRLQITRTQTTGTTSGNTIALPSNLVEPTSLRLGTDEEVQWVDDDVWNSWVDSGDDPGYTFGRIFGSNVELYPTPDTGTAYALRYISAPADLSADADVVALPTELQIKMVQYAQAEALFKEGELAKADRKMQEYEDGLPSRPLGRKRILPGTPVIGFEPNSFDSDLESMHL